jgi:hypothetical protein
MRNISGWVRLAIVLSALWIVGIGLYGAYVWHNARDVDSPFVYYVIPNWQPEGGYFLANRLDRTYGSPQPRFKHDYFFTVVGVVLVGIWVVTVGTAWVINGFRHEEERPSINPHGIQAGKPPEA